MKHYFTEMTEDETGTHHGECKRCGIKTRYLPLQTTRQFLLDGKWVRKTPTCEPKKA